MLKRHEISVLLKAGHSKIEVARLAGVSLRSVQRVVKEGDIQRIDDAAEHLERGIGRPSLIQDFRKRVTELVEKESGLLSVEVLRRMRLDGYMGQKSALYALIASVRPKDQKPLVRFERSAGGIQPARLRTGGRRVPRRDDPEDPFLRFAPEVFENDAGLDRR